METSNRRGQSSIELVLLMLLMVVFLFSAQSLSVLSRHWLKTAQLSKEVR